MRLSFHGADRGVTGSCHLIEAAGRKILIDCGAFQGGRALQAQNALQQAAVANDTADFSRSDIDAEIAATRRARRRK